MSSLLTLKASRVALLLLLPLSVFSTHASAQSGPPVAGADSYTAHGRLTVPPEGGLFANDYDPGGCCSITQPHMGYSGTPNGTLYLIPDGSFFYTPNDGFSGTDSWWYQICNLSGCSVATITFNVANAAPVAGGDSFTAHGRVDVPAPGVLANDSDPDGDPISIQNLADNCLYCWVRTGHGMAYLEGTGAFSYVPDYGYAGADSTYYKLCDNLGMCSNATISLNVTNGAPAARADVYGVRAGTWTETYRLDVPAPGILANDSDPDGDPFSIQNPRGGIITDHGSVSVRDDGSISYLPNAWFTGVDKYAYTVCDNIGACSSAVIYFYVYPGGSPDPPQSCACPLDAPSGGASGPSAPDPVNLATGRESFVPEPDLVVYNPNGPGVTWRRQYLGYRASKGYGSPGLSLGWVHTYDTSIEGPAEAGAWGALKLIYYNGAEETLTPQLDAGGQPTGAFSAPAGSIYLVTGVPGASAGQWQSLTVTWKDQTRWRFTPLSTGLYALTQITDRVGRGVALSWGGGRTLSQVSDTTSGDTLLSLAYDAGGELSTATDAYGRQVSYSFSTRTGTDPGKLQSVSQVVAAGTPNPPPRWGYAYTASDDQQLSTMSVPGPTGSGTSTASINYGAGGKVASLVDASGNRREYVYNSGSTQVQVKDAAGNVNAAWTQNFNGSGRNTGTSDANGNSNVFEYGDPQNPSRPTRVADKNGKATAYTYDQYGNVLTVTTPRNVTTTYTYDYTPFALGRLVSVKESTKPATTFAYFEPSGLLQGVTSPSPAGTGTVTASFTYDALGNVLTATSPGNNAASQITTTLNYTTDGAYTQAAKVGQPLTATDNLGHATHLRYDAQGRVTSRTDALGNETDAAYNLVGQITETTYPATGQTGTGHARAVNSYLYPGGPLTAVTLFDESNVQARQVSYRYGPEGETLSVAGSTEPVSYTYDALYRLKTLKDGKNNQTTYSYNSVGLVSQVQMPGGETVQFTSYDNAGHLLQRVDGNNVTTNYLYNDAENRLTDIQYPATPALNVHFGYDSFGRRNAMTDSAGGHAYVYGDLDELKSVTTTYAGLSAQTISYTYYADGRRQAMTTPAGTFSYGYDGAGRASSLTNPFGETTSWAYYDNNRLNTQTLANGALTTYTFNALGQLSELLNQTGGGATLSDFGQITHDGAGNRTSVTASVPGASTLGGTTTYQYDAKDQLQQEQTTRGSGFTDGFGYDPAGNPTTFRGAAKAYNSNNQQSDAGFTHDSNGNPTSYNGVPLSFDPENRLTAYGSALTAGYTGDGLRAWKESAGGRTYFIYDGAVPVVELDSAGAVTATNTFGAAGLVSRRSGSQSTFYAFDPQGSVAQRLDESGAVISSHLFRAHGAELTTPVADPFGYGARWGYYTDSETGLQLLTHRYYDPAAGRFLTRDPIGYGGGVNLYAYVQNAPVDAIDPLGHDMLTAEQYDRSAAGQAISPEDQQWWGGFWAAWDHSRYENRPWLEGCINDQLRDPSNQAILVNLGALDGFLGDAAAGSEEGAEEFVNLASPERTNHILYGDGTGGGHLWPGQPGKTPFPADWSPERIMHAISDIATDPNIPWTPQTGSGGLFTRAGNPARFSADGVSGGIGIRVIVEPAGQGIITGFPH
jgi:RHS repeat-associated protein